MGGGRRVSHKPLVSKFDGSAFGSADVFVEAPLRKSGKVVERRPCAGQQPIARTKADKGKANKSQAVLPVRQMELHDAIQSLYTDELKPYGRILRKRLAEMNVNAGKEVDLGMLRKFCESDAELRVESEDGGEWSAVFAKLPEPFIDVYSKDDPYCENTWETAREYFETLSEQQGVLPGGRYACAQALRARTLPFFNNFTLGRICHFIQIAISTRKVLGYLNGGITGYGHSHSCMKDSAATQGQSCGKPTIVSELKVATWKDARRCLKRILIESLKSGVAQVPLSNIKRICRSQFDMELSETSLGHSKLSDFLQDDRLSDICTVRLLDQGYFVIPLFEAPDSTSDSEAGCSESSAFSFDDEQSRLMVELNGIEENCETPYWADRRTPQHFDISLDVLAKPLDVQWYSMSPRAKMVQNTFIHAPPTPVVRINRRSHSVPREVGNCQSPLFCPLRISARSPAMSSLTPIALSSPVDAIPQTPDHWAAITPAASPFPHSQVLLSVPESGTFETEKFSWADMEPSRDAFGCFVNDFQGLDVDVPEPLPASPSPFLTREAPLLTDFAHGHAPVALCLADCI